jgi:hypothetical protein
VPECFNKAATCVQAVSNSVLGEMFNHKLFSYIVCGLLNLFLSFICCTSVYKTDFGRNYNVCYWQGSFNRNCIKYELHQIGNVSNGDCIK